MLTALKNRVRNIVAKAWLLLDRNAIVNSQDQNKFWLLQMYLSKS